MKYTTKVIINLPLERTIELFDSTDNLYKWQKGLQSFEHISGEPGQPGAKSKLKFDMNGRKIEMVETITHRNLPHEFHATYDAKGVHNLQENYFEETGDGQSKWTSVSEFQFSGFMKLVGFFMKGAFPKQTKSTMNAFREFAEKEGG